MIVHRLTAAFTLSLTLCALRTAEAQGLRRLPAGTGVTVVANGENRYRVQAFDRWEYLTDNAPDFTVAVALIGVVKEERSGWNAGYAIASANGLADVTAAYDSAGPNECYVGETGITATNVITNVQLQTISGSPNGRRCTDAYQPPPGGMPCTPEPDPWEPGQTGGDVQDPNNCTDPDALCCGASPILVDLGRHGFDLTGSDDAVPFDLFAVGRPGLYSWTATGSVDAFLCLDRNGDGEVNDGSELFGNHTRLASGEVAPNGYVALRDFDSPLNGGNGDRVIDAHDPVFAALRLWIDSNHDGRSTPDELQPLASAGIVRLSTDYRESRRRDRYGNLLRYWGSAWLMDGGGRLRAVDTCDVYFTRPSATRD